MTHRGVRRLQVTATASACVLLGLVLHGSRGVPTYGAVAGGDAVLLSNADGQNAYASVVRYNGRASCSGVLLDVIPDGEDPGDAPAYVATNGHCSDFPGPNEVLPDRPVSRHTVTFDYFVDTRASQVIVPVSRVVYASMKGQDIAVLELEARYADLARQGLAGWRPAERLPADTEPVVTVGAPLQQDSSKAYLRLAACDLEGHAPVVQEYVWHWYDFMRLACRGVAPGSSGSPVISRVSGHVIGLLNTTTQGGRAPYTACALDHPCEPQGSADPVGLQEMSYATPLVRLGRCFDDAGRFDLAGHGCPLDPGRQIGATPSQLGALNPTLASSPIGRVRTRWDVVLADRLDLPYHRYKVVATPGQECRDLRGYGPPRRTLVAPVIDDPLPTRDGTWYLCILAGPDERWSSGWQSVAFPTVVKVRIDTVPPRITPPLSIRESTDGWFVEFLTQEPEVAGYRYKYGPAGRTSCADGADYRPSFIPFITLQRKDGPFTFCAIPYDAAMNEGALVERLLM
ncbi:trypsin [Luteitalea sp. TBR-22]|uniref:trypsin-like serine peptidase n=1 Tax=Luteitalea sp. TBR-22 TaxID=2802971 RepID=UPI001AF0E1F8|nr:trypsin-like peptidase domain-containing protein [Luteitalea sp. TBR-22]BCS35188.1 trypsin [Luteitalea sp. TBR-22]